MSGIIAYFNAISMPILMPFRKIYIQQIKVYKSEILVTIIT